jgi:cysteine synthase A
MNAGKSDKAEKPAEKEKTSEKKTDAKGAISMLEPRGKIYDSVLHTIGGTPMVRLPRIMEKYKLEADLVAKLEYFNPMSSVKDRAALAMVEDAERAGKIKPGQTTLIEATAGNTAHSLAFVAAAKGYKLILVMPETVAFERRKMLLFMGAELVLTPGNTGMKGAIEKAKELIEKSKTEIHTFNQFENKTSVKTHAETTAEEIWADTAGKIDILVAGVGSGATLAGITQVLKKKKEDLKTYAVEPAESSVLSGMKNPVQHQIVGIGAGFVPPLFDPKSVDGILKVESERALELARELAKTEGIAGGISSGAALAAAIDVASNPENKGKMIVLIISSFAERYITTPLFAKAL